MADSTHPVNQSEFESLMEGIDEALRDEGVPIPHRELRALQELAKRLGEGFFVGPFPTDYEPSTFRGTDLAFRAIQWVNDRYGKRLAWEMRPGRVVVLIRGDPWELWMPRFIGSHRLIADPLVDSDPIENPVNPRKPIPRFNILEAISDLTPALRRSLSNEECEELSVTFRAALENLRVLEKAARNHTLVRQALADLDSSSHLILGPAPSPGQAKWAALQLAEKSIKAFTLASGKKPPHRHDLSELAEQAESLGAGRMPRPWLAAVQCDAGVRYGHPSVQISEAVTAQHHALDIAAHVVADFVLYGH